MNFVTAEKAYCLYPKATFMQQQTLVTGSKPIGWDEMGEFYDHLGVDMLKGMMSLEDETTFSAGAYRIVEDSNSWIIPLDLEGIVALSPINTRTLTLSSDPSVPNVWRLLEFSNGPFLDYRIATYPVLRYKYLTAHGEHTKMLRDFCEKEGWKAKDLRTRDIANQQKPIPKWCVLLCLH